MNSKKKQAAAVLLAAGMAVTAGCANQTQSTETQETKGDEKVTFQIAVSLNPLCKDEDFNHQKAFQEAEEATGVHIEWVPIAAADAEDKVNIMLASDLPDAFLGLIGESQIVGNMDSFLDLTQNDMLKTYAPHVYADYEKLNGGLDIVTWPDGSIRSLMTGRQTSYENDAEGIMFINQSWLDRVGMEVPTTIDEFYDVMCAFRDQDANGNGDPSDEIPFEPSQSDWCSKIMNLANPWGIAGTDSSDESAYKRIKDGKVEGTVDKEAFKEFLNWAHMLVEEGLMDQEAFSQTSEQYHSKISEGIVGCYYTWSPYADMSEAEAENWVPVPVLDDGNGNYVKTGSQDKFAADRTGFSITSECENPEKLLEWWDYLSSTTDRKYTVRFGERGQAWDTLEDGTYVETIPENLTDDFTIENYKYTYGMADLCPYITKEENTVVEKENSFTSWYRIDCVEKVHDHLIPAEDQVPIRFVDSDKVSERTFIETELFSYINNFIATSILNGVSDEQWAAHLEQLDAVQYGTWLTWYQDYLDGKF